MYIPRGGGGGGTQVQRAAASALCISRKKGSFLRPPHVRDFVKEGYFIVPRYEVRGGGGKNPLLILTQVSNYRFCTFMNTSMKV